MQIKSRTTCANASSQSVNEPDQTDNTIYWVIIRAKIQTEQAPHKSSQHGQRPIRRILRFRPPHLQKHQPQNQIHVPSLAHERRNNRTRSTRGSSVHLAHLTPKLSLPFRTPNLLQRKHLGLHAVGINRLLLQQLPPRPSINQQKTKTRAQ